MSKTLLVKRALKTDAAGVDDLLSEWFDWKPISGRLKSVQRAARKKELLVAEADSRVVGFIHYVMHEDIIDGGPNAFISAFYVSEAERGKGVGTLLLEKATSDSLARGAVGVETSTIHMRAKQLYERHHFKQTMGDIGEAFLELDIAEYSQVRKRAGLTEH
ncbi:GNAT family N-acetyltransferase [Candidatus Bathyarchaeota archaeon]|nr:MAG: GNAT family N-acetyltransferase [Candidatus Bathyarchaeota archaeon]